jgi:hypothetical protein
MREPAFESVRNARRIIAAGSIVLAAGLAVGGCGGNSSAPTSPVTSATQATASTSSPAAQAAPSVPGFTSCGLGTGGEEVYADSGPSCPFALNVEMGWQGSPLIAAGSEPASFNAYSHSTGFYYTMNCTGHVGQQASGGSRRPSCRMHRVRVALPPKPSLNRASRVMGACGVLHCLVCR